MITKTYNCEFLSVGTEILLGQILNTNAKYLSEQMSALGINVFFQTTVGDNVNRLKSALSIALSRADIIVATGGLGPTADDLTKETIAEFLNLPMHIDENSYKDIEAYFNERAIEMNTLQKKQAFIPDSSFALKNNNGTAPGIIIETVYQDADKIIIILPGPPKEMAPMFQESVVPYLRKLSQYSLYSNVIRIFGMGESNVELILSDMMKHSTNPTIAPYAKEGETTLRVTAKAKNADEAQELLMPIIEKIKIALGDVIYDIADTPLAEICVKTLLNNNNTLALAESCTGGLISKRITDISGASKVLKEGFVVYSNEAKMKYLGVAQETLEKYGAVSQECAREMVDGLYNTSHADVCISVTGIAGPNSDSSEKPVGLVYVGVRFNEETKVYEYRFSKNGRFVSRDKIRHLTSLRVFDIIRRLYL